MHWAYVNPEHPVLEVQMHAYLALGWEHPLVTQGQSLPFAHLHLSRNLQPCPGHDSSQENVGVGPEVSGVSLPHPDSGPTIKAQGRCPSLSQGHGEPCPAEPWALQQTTLLDCAQFCKYLRPLFS